MKDYDRDLAMMAATVAAGLMPAAERTARDMKSNPTDIRHDVAEIAVKVSEEIVSMLQDKRRKETVFNG